MKALSFLGMSDYESVTYVWQGKEYETDLFPEAVARIFGPEKVMVFVTPQVKESKNIKNLAQRLGDLLESVDIPEGRSEQELWEIFDRVAGSVNKGDTVLLDITHAFRSIPLVVFAVAAYLRRTKGVTVEHIVYGAYEARDQTNRVPIFDLTLLLDLLDWLGGAAFFLRRSDATLLGEQLRSVHQQAQRAEPGEDWPRRLQKIGNRLALFSQALHLARPLEVMDHAHRLQEMMEGAVPEVQRWAKPFAVILKQVQSEVEEFAHDAPGRLDKKNLEKQLAMIQHFVDKDLWVQAVTLAREWVVTWVAFQRGKGDWLDRSNREEIGKILGATKQKLQGESVTVPDWFDNLPQSESVARVWDWLTQLRNDVAHCGMRKDAAGIKSIRDRVKTIPQRLTVLMKDTPERALYGARVVLDVKSLYGDVAKLDELPHYLERAKALAGEGNEVVLTGQGPIWLYLAVAHALHGKARRLLYVSPPTGEVRIFDHSSAAP